MRRLLLASTLLCLTAGVGADYCPPDSPQSGGMRDIMLAYMGKEAWKQPAFLPYVAYLDKRQGGKAVDWFYDSWLFLMFGGAPSGGSYAFGTATKADWDHYFDLLYAPEQNLAALNACMEDVGHRLGARNRVAPVIIMIPHLDAGMKDFGDVDGDGRPDDASRNADRGKAFRWAVDTILARWKPESYPHLKLWGFYWMNEGVYGPDEEVCKETAAYCRAKGYGLHWIPWFRAGGFERTRELGFDFVVMQPNYAFMKNPPGAVVPDEGRLTQNANSCRDNGLGVEMELDTGTETSPGKRLNLQLYLNHGVDELDGYMKGAVRAYYQAEDYIHLLYKSDLPDCNRLYNDLYRFHKGTYRRRVVSLCEGAKATLSGRPAPKLTDGLWMNRAEREDRLLTAAAPAVIDLDLGPGQIVGDLRVHLAARDAGQPSRPRMVRVETSPDGQAYQRAAEEACPDLAPIGEMNEGFVLATFAPRFARRVRITLDGTAGSQVGVDEVVMFPTPHLLWAAPCKLTGKLIAPAAPEAGMALTDGRLAVGPGQPGGARFTGEGAATLRLPDAWLLSRALAHVQWRGRGPGPQCRVVTFADGRRTHQTAWTKAAGPGTAWLELPLPSAKSSEVRFELRGGPEVYWDELQVRPTPNLALGKPYRAMPEHKVTYPDTDGKELTDGRPSEKGFGDGRTVGWYDQQVTLTLDLGAERSPDAVRVHAQGGGYAAVNYPHGIKVFGSTDAKEWRLIAAEEPAKEVAFTEQMGDELLELAWLKLPVEPGPVRYLRLHFLPQGWLMLSEVEALEGGRNAATGCEYHLVPRPKSEEKYADDGVRLTDGDTSSSADGWGKAAGWIGVAPEVTVDLLAPQRVDLVRAHVLGGGPGGVYFPPSMTVATSEDGRVWSEEIIVACALPESGEDPQVAFMDAKLMSRAARYVRLRFAARGWGMVDEVQVFDTSP